MNTSIPPVQPATPHTTIWEQLAPNLRQELVHLLAEMLLRSLKAQQQAEAAHEPQS